MNTNNSNEYISDASFFISDYHFSSTEKSEFLNLYPDEKLGAGNIIEINPYKGLHLSCANWYPKIDMERKFSIQKKIMKLYYFESGNVTLIQNGKKKIKISQGVNLYYNKPSSGRVLYAGKTPICYVSLLLHEEYIDRLLAFFPKHQIAFPYIFSWKPGDYNCMEIGKIFMQIREKMIKGVTSSAYYESKIIEALSLIAQNHQTDHEIYTNANLTLPHTELSQIECVRQAICKSPLAPPSTEELCRISAMSQTKLRELFRKTYGITLGRYIQQNKLEQSLVLLADASLSIAKIAEILGYSNTSKFSAAFKKIYKKNPSKYRSELTPIS